ncbi:MAG: hypothetical protein ACT4P3_14950 [Betaproteobacteria bacterium]
MFARTSAFLLALGAALALPAHAQSGLRLPQRAEGLDPTFARGWLAPEYDHFGFATYRWRDDSRAGSRMHWSYSLTDRASLGMSLGNSRELDEQRQFSLFGSYWLSPDWALSAETTTGRDPGGVLRLQDIRIGVQRRF